MIELERINFKNGASGKTPLNSTNLNKLQDNVESYTKKYVAEENLIERILLQGNSIQEGTPSIDNEAPVESVGDNINIYNENGETTTSYFDNTGKLVAVADSFNKIEIEPIYTQYVMSHAGIKGVAYVRFSYFNGDTFISREVSEVSGHVFTVPVNCTKIDIRVNNDSKGFTDLKLEKGTKATPYSPCGQGSVEIYNCNENWFDKNNTSSAIGGASGYVASDYIPAKFGDKIAKSNATTLYFYDSSKTLIQGVSNWKTGTIAIENTAYVRCNVLSTDINTFMLVKNQNLPSEYIQGKTQTKILYTQQPFRAIGDVKDRFVKQNGVWYEEHSIERVILNGTENWGKSSNTKNNLFYLQAIFNTLINKGISNYFTYQIVWDIDIVGIEIYNNRNLRFGLGLNSDITTLEQWKAKLTELYNAGTPLYVDYVLATPNLIPCTPEQVEVLNDIYSAYGEGMTNIICNDEIEPVIEIVKETKETVQSENDKAISMLLARIEELEKKIQ